MNAKRAPLKILFCTQVVDKNDPSTSFFHEWLVKFAPLFHTITVFCLKKGSCDLPPNVIVYSLGKERFASSPFKKLIYGIRLLYLTLWQFRAYSTVFVHMNQEFILVSGWLWKLLNKNIFLWYNHYTGSPLTDIAALFCKKVFYTSKFSYTAKYRKGVQMPVGVDIASFTKDTAEEARKSESVLFLGRITKSKRVDVFIDALRIVSEDGIRFSASIYGPSTSEEDCSYRASMEQMIEKNGLATSIRLFPGVSHHDIPDIYSQHQIFVNCSKSGMYDKTIFEAAARGCLVIASSKDFEEIAGHEYYFPFGASDSLAEHIKLFISLDETQLKQKILHMQRVANMHSLDSLGLEIVRQIT